MKLKKYVIAAVFGAVCCWGQAQAACTSPTAESGDFQFKSSDRKIYKCSGSTWSVVNEPTTLDYNTADGFVIVGANGGNVVKPCPVQNAGEPCGGGLYVGDVNLVASPGGCYDNYTVTDTAFADFGYQPRSDGGPLTACPNNYEARDFRRMRWASFSGSSSESAAGATYKSTMDLYSHRYGYAFTEVFKNISGGDIFQFCANMVVNTTENGVAKTYSDWYVPTAYELARLLYATTRVGGSGYGTTQNGNYWSGTEGGVSGDQAIQGNLFMSLPEEGYLAVLNGGQSRNGNNRIRCVRRN